jgi:hypothetical protein
VHFLNNDYKKAKIEKKISWTGRSTMEDENDRVNFLLAIKKFWFLIAHKKSNFPIGYWFDFFFIDHPNIKVRE